MQPPPGFTQQPPVQTGQEWGLTGMQAVQPPMPARTQPASRTSDTTSQRPASQQTTGSSGGSSVDELRPMLSGILTEIPLVVNRQPVDLVSAGQLVHRSMQALVEQLRGQKSVDLPVQPTIAA